MNTPATPPAAPATTRNPPPNPFGRPSATQCVQRDYKPQTGAGPDGFGPPTTRTANIAPQGRGGHCVEFSKPEGHSLALAFNVTAQNVSMDSFEFAKELNKTTDIPMDAAIVSADGHIIGQYSGRDTGTDEPHGRYVVQGAAHNGKTVPLPIGLYYYFADTPDGSAAKMPIWHSGAN